jgi:hypothetical protein
VVIGSPAEDGLGLEVFRDTAAAELAPIPDCLKPPNGASRELTISLTITRPERIWRAT